MLAKEKYKSIVLSPAKFKIGLMAKLPMGAIAGLKITKLTDDHCEVTVPYKFINKNPFNTTYWAVLGMAAEMASGALVQMYTYQTNPSVSMFVTGCNAKFIKRAIGKTTFVCTQGILVKETIEKAMATMQPQTITNTVIGYDKDKNILVEFTFEWSVKARSNK